MKHDFVADGPVRMCVICRRRFPKAALTRHVLTPQGNLSIDPEKVRPGRGWYLCSDPVCALKFAKYRPGARRAAAVMRKTRIALAVAAQPLAEKDSRDTDGDSLDKGGKHA
ncbi:YlxR family protein [Desulfovibrio sp. ZJ369]|uniref:YlxR family protein n=1 Tax=Desulfovibrio sp. ZJ369 TaxID=2709793 RepID=UPI0032168FCB